MTSCGLYGTEKTNVSSITCENCVELQVELDKNYFEQGEVITVTASVSVQDGIQLWAPYESSPLKNFEVEIIDGHGQHVPLTEEGLIEVATGGRLVYQDYPFEESFQLDKWFMVSKPDTYTLTVTYRAVNDFSEKVEVIGKPVIFERLP